MGVVGGPLPPPRPCPGSDSARTEAGQQDRRGHVRTLHAYCLTTEKPHINVNKLSMLVYTVGCSDLPLFVIF